MITRSENKIPGEIICSFKTNLPEEYKIDQDQEIGIKSDLTEKELSQYLVQLINTEKDQELDQNTKFEFLINQEFLRGDIKSHLLKHKVDAEKTVVIHYIFGLNKPKEDKKIEEEDWIKNIALIEGNTDSKNSLVLSLFSGELSFYNKNLEFQKRFKISQTSIRQSEVVENYVEGLEGDYLIFSGCQDETIKVGTISYTGDKNNKKKDSKQQVNYKLEAECVENGGSVESISINSFHPEILAAGNFQGGINLFKITKNDLAEDQYQTNEKGKKVKLDKKRISPISNKKLNEFHSECVTSIDWLTGNTLLTGSFDHHIKGINIEHQKETFNINTKDSAVTCLTYINNLCISGHEDSYIKTWDNRENQSGPKNVFKGHSLWISDIKMLNKSEFLFMTTSYDHQIKVWDLRSSFPLFNIKTHHDKVFSCQWNGDQNIVAGGSDKILSSHTFNQQ